MLQRYWFLAALAVVVPIGFFAPSGGAVIRASGALPWLVALALFVSGFLLDASKLRAQALEWRVILAGLASIFVVAPVLAWLLAHAFAPGSMESAKGVWFLEAVMIAASQAGTIASAIALTIVARGSQEMALVLTVASNGLTAFLTPLVLSWSIGANVSFDAAHMIGDLALVVLVPVVCGQIARRLLWRHAARWKEAIRVLPQLGILVFVHCGFGAAAERLSSDAALALRFLAVCAATHLGLIAWNAGVARVLGLSRDVRAALVFCGSQKTLPNGMFLWDEFFASNPYGAVPLALYHVFQLVFDTFLVPWLDGSRE